MEPTLLEPTEIDDSPALSDILTNADRCDQCGAQAYHLVQDIPGAESGLLFCNHHFRRNEEKLRRLTDNFIDESYKINEKPSQSSPG